MSKTKKSNTSAGIVRYIREILILAVVIIVMGGVAFFAMASYTRHDEVFPTPDLSGMTLEEAEKTIISGGYRYVVIDSSRYEPDKLPSEILSQDPEAGSGIKHGRKIYLKINRSSWEDAIVPHIDFENDKINNVRSRLIAAGFVVGEVIYEPHIGLDVVLGISSKDKELTPGESLPKQTVIDITVGDGGTMADSLLVEETEEF